MNKLNFTFSDTVAGYVTDFDQESQNLTLKTSDDRRYQVKIKDNTYAMMTRNLGEPYRDATGQMRQMLTEGRFLFVYGVFYPETDDNVFEAQFILFVGRTASDYFFEKKNWWVEQIEALGEFYLNAQFGSAENIRYEDYRTTLSLGGQRSSEQFRQETDTISRLVYGFASAYLLTGNESFLQAAEVGTQYLRDHMRFYDLDENIVYWYHGIDVDGRRETKIFASEFGDDYDAIPAYEQIYALAGPIQTYRITGDPKILRDAELTVALFDRFYVDKERGGYYSHLDPITLDPLSDTLGENRGKKNWNSVGDHAPAYLINLWLATQDEHYEKMLEETFDTIVEHFPDYDNSPFVQEKFLEDWSHDQTHMWQQNRGVVGHNLKIAWNLMRMFGRNPKPEYEELARRIAEEMPKVGADRQRGGWYDVMERVKGDDQQWYRYAFHDRKAWWQQEQGILAYLIMHGILGDEEYQQLARESAAFYNAFFLDHDDGAVYFNVLANGIPYLLGTERLKGSHSMSGYHSFELAYLSQIYINLLRTGEPLTLYFKPQPNGFKDNILYVSPDILPENSVEISAVWIDDEPYDNFDAQGLSVQLPESDKSIRVRVQLQPISLATNAQLTNI